MKSLDGLGADEVIAELGLEHLDGEGCWIRLLWRSEHGSAIYGFLTPRDFSALHVLREDEMWVHIAGDPIGMLLLHQDGRVDTIELGADLAAGQTPWARVPAGTWQGSVTRGAWSLVVCSLTPAFSAFTLADAETDLSAWPDAAEEARGLIRG